MTRPTAMWTGVSDAHDPSRAVLIEIRKHIVKKFDEGIAASKKYHTSGYGERSAKAWSATQTLLALVKHIDAVAGWCPETGSDETTSPQASP